MSRFRVQTIFKFDYLRYSNGIQIWWPDEYKISSFLYTFRIQIKIKFVIKFVFKLSPFRWLFEHQIMFKFEHHLNSNHSSNLSISGLVGCARFYRFSTFRPFFRVYCCLFVYSRKKKFFQGKSSGHCRNWQHCLMTKNYKTVFSWQLFEKSFLSHA